MPKRRKQEKKLNIAKQLHNKEKCFSRFNSDIFFDTNTISSKNKKGMYNDWEKPNLNKQINHLTATLSF